VGDHDRPANLMLIKTAIGSQIITSNRERGYVEVSNSSLDEDRRGE
jgi:hypothetical protein